MHLRVGSQLGSQPYLKYAMLGSCTCSIGHADGHPDMLSSSLPSTEASTKSSHGGQAVSLCSLSCAVPP